MKHTYNETIDNIMINYFDFLRKSNKSQFSVADINYYFRENYPKIKFNTIEYYLLKYSINIMDRKYYRPKSDGSEDLLYRVSHKKYLIYNNGKNILLPQNFQIKNIKENNLISENNNIDNENDLKNIVVNNLHLIENNLKLYEEDGIIGIEFPAGGRFIDILALDENNNYVVIELKYKRAYDRVIGQLLRYMNWIKKYMAEDKIVRGIIIGNEITKDLYLACSGLLNIELYEYNIPIKFNKKENKM